MRQSVAAARLARNCATPAAPISTVSAHGRLSAAASATAHCGWLEAQRKVIKETTRKNAKKAAGPVARVVNAWAIKLFAKLSKPEKMAWIFAYRIDWEAKVTSPAPPGASPRQSHAGLRRPSARRRGRWCL